MRHQDRDKKKIRDIEGKVLVEDDTHAVITLCVDKAFFVRNSRLLARLADIVLIE